MVRPALVFVPGMLCDRRLFAPQLAALSDEYDCMVGDVAQDASIVTMAARILAQAPPHFALAGLSLGGIVAMEIIRQAPERVTHLALMATNHRAAGQAFIDIRTEQIGRARAGGLRRIVIEEMKGHYLAERNATDAALLALVVDMAMQCGAPVFEKQARALIARRDQSDTLRDWRKPVLLLCGAEDDLCPPATHEAMAALMPQAKLAILPQTGHLLTLESPEAATAHLQKWLEN